MKTTFDLIFEDDKFILIKKWLFFKYPIAEARVRYYPNCESIAILNAVSVNEKYRLQGYGKMLINKLLEYLTSQNIANVQCTVIDTNDKMKKLMTATDFIEINRFHNKRTSNTVLTFSRNV